MSNESNADAENMKGHREWKAMSEGGTAHNWQGHLSNLSAEKTLAQRDPLTPTLYQKPERDAKGWSNASGAQRGSARKYFLSSPLPQG